MSLTSYRAAPPRVKSFEEAFDAALTGNCEANAGKCRAEKALLQAPHWHKLVEAIEKRRS